MELMHRTLTPEDCGEAIKKKRRVNGGSVVIYIDIMIGQRGCYGELRVDLFE